MYVGILEGHGPFPDDVGEKVASIGVVKWPVGIEKPFQKLDSFSVPGMFMFGFSVRVT
jgi:hypothetical protein